MGCGEGPAEDNGIIFCAGETWVPLAGKMEPCPNCGGSGEREGWFEGNGGW